MDVLPPPTTAPAGWYPDPQAPGALRYFDGRTWAPSAAFAPAFAKRLPHPTLPARAAVGALVLLISSLVGSAALAELIAPIGLPPAAELLVLATIGYAPAVAWGVYCLRRWHPGGWRDLGWPAAWGDLGWGAVTWLTAVVAQVSVALLLMLLDVPFESNVEPIGEYDVTTWSKVVAVIVVAGMAPVFEEFVFRGIVLRGFLDRMSVPLAIGLQGVLFGAAHIDPVRGAGNIGLAIVLSAVGVVLGGSAYLRRRIGTPIVTHAIINGLVMTLLLTGALDDIESPFESVLGALVLSFG